MNRDVIIGRIAEIEIDKSVAIIVEQMDEEICHCERRRRSPSSDAEAGT